MPIEKIDYFNMNKPFEEKSKTSGSEKFDPTTDAGSISVGLLLLSAGILLLINNLVPGFQFRKFWPVILIIVGGGLMLGHRQIKSQKEETNESNDQEPQ